MNFKAFYTILFLGLLTRTAVTGAPTPTATVSPSPRPTAAESFWEALIRFAGVSHNPNTLKGPDDDIVSGQIWIAELSQHANKKLTSNDLYRSPVFVPGSTDVVGLRGTDVVRLPSSGGDEAVLYSIPGIVKLVGFRADDPDTLLIVVKEERPRPALLSLKSGTLTRMPYISASGRDALMLEHLLGWERVYGDKMVYVARHSKLALSGPVEWSDVYYKTGRTAPINVSECDGSSCGQPSLSEDALRIVYVKVGRH